MNDYDFSPVTACIQNWIDRGYYPGAGLLVAKDDRVVYERYFGGYDHRTVIFMASAGKWLAAATIAGVVDDGKLSWSDTAAKWIPELADAKGHATLRELLSHTAGYPDYQPKGLPRDDYQTLAESVAHIVPLPARTEPGKVFHYGGLTLQVAGRLAEKATGKDWETLFQEKVALPLRMTRTRFTPVDREAGHNPMLGGGARGSLRDYASFLCLISQEGVFEGRRILSRQSIAEMQADQVRGAVVPAREFVERACGRFHKAVYGLGQWREELDAGGGAVLLSSPSWAGAYPWIDKTYNVYGIFLAHVDIRNGAAARDEFSGYFSSPKLARLVRMALTPVTYRGS